MSNARLISVEVERFKSYEAATRIDLAPLTVIVGRNNQRQEHPRLCPRHGHRSGSRARGLAT